MGLEPMTSSLPRTRSTTELQQPGAAVSHLEPPGLITSLSTRRGQAQNRPRAGDGNRTHTTSLEGWSSTIELRPRLARTRSIRRKANVWLRRVRGLLEL